MGAYSYNEQTRTLTTREGKVPLMDFVCKTISVERISKIDLPAQIIKSTLGGILLGVMFDVDEYVSKRQTGPMEILTCVVESNWLATEAILTKIKKTAAENYTKEINQQIDSFLIQKKELSDARKLLRYLRETPKKRGLH